MKRIYAKLERRYGSMFTLYLWAVVSIGSIATFAIEIPELLHHQVSSGKIVTLTSYLLMIILLSAQVFRLDCRNMISNRTANIIYGCSAIILLLQAGPSIAIRWLSLDYPEAADSMYSVFNTIIYFIGFMLTFVGRILQRAARLQEEQDLTI